MLCALLFEATKNTKISCKKYISTKTSSDIQLHLFSVFCIRPHIETRHFKLCTRKPTQSTVLPVPIRHRRYACIQMRTALPANTKTRPNVVSILKQHRVKCSRLLGSTQVSVYTHPSATIIFSPADQGTFSKTAGQSQAYYNT